MIVDPPKGLRKGQTMFLFLTWLAQKDKVPATLICYTGKSANKRDDSHFHMGDPFNISDTRIDALFAEFLKELEPYIAPAEA